MDARGTVEGIYIATERGGAAHGVHSVTAHAGRGLEGDRHFDDPDACDITLIEVEALDALRDDFGLALEPGQSRRQVHVRGLDLASLIGRRFRVGEVECQGEERCEPCNDLVGLLQAPIVLRGLLHTGLRASVVKNGVIASGDTVELVESREPVAGELGA